MDPGFGLWLFAVSLGASALGGMLGMASGILIVPILTTFGHLDIRTAIGASLVSVIACSCACASPLLKGGLVNIRLAVVLETKYDMPLVEAEYRLEAVAAEPVVAEALGVETGSPLFLIERTSYCAGNQPVDYEQLYYRGDMVRFVTRLARGGKEGK